MSANRVTDVVLLPGIIGVSPMRFNDLIMVNHKLIQNLRNVLIQHVYLDFVLSQARVSRSRRSASESKERTSVRD